MHLHEQRHQVSF